jgi:hydrogenase nickel incorporation protein HypB
MARIPVVKDILSANAALADDVRARLDRSGVFAVNMMASPGAGKTCLVEATIRALGDGLRVAYVDGDVETTIDAQRIDALGVPVVQINTGGSCHLDANMLSLALPQLPLDRVDLLIVENVGNLICPAAFRLGTHLSVLIASIPEGDDKPYKYPAMYRGVDVLIINKIDLLPYIPFDLDYFKRGVQALNPGLKAFEVSALKGDGIDAWVSWLGDKVAADKAAVSGCIS